MKVADLVDDELKKIVSFSLYRQVPAQNALLSKCERGGAKRRRESYVNENSKVAPPGLSSFRHPCQAQRYRGKLKGPSRVITIIIART